MPTSSLAVERVRHELQLREVKVLRVEALGGHFASITFGGPSLASFVSPGFDDHVKFMFTDSDGETIKRDYTPRRFDAEACELTIEFALHGGGKASDWARHAAPGQPATIGGPRGSMIVPTGYDWHLLAGDATALPAIKRRLEELPADRTVIVMVAAAPEDRTLSITAPNVRLQWVDGDEQLVSAVEAVDFPSGPGFVWCAGEAAAMKEIRRHLAEVGHPKEAMRVSAYWKKGEGGHHENL